MMNLTRFFILWKQRYSRLVFYLIGLFLIRVFPIIWLLFSVPFFKLPVI